jgi:threonylcarbamoyladenosine tRNA methylthiotransferase MtaB
MEPEKKFKVVTLGCRTNQYESQGYTDQLKALGFSESKSDEEASLCIVNTCTVTASADANSRHAILKLHRDNPNAKIVVTGCYAENKPELIKSLPGVQEVISNQNKHELIAHLFPDIEVPEFAIQQFAAHTRAFVKVQDGCDSFCTYCVIPYVRGRSRSRATSDIINEVKGLIANGYKEIVLTGINIGDFDGGETMKPPAIGLRI